MNCGLSPALSAITTKPVRVPVAVGLNVTPKVQVSPAPTLYSTATAATLLVLPPELTTTAADAFAATPAGTLQLI
jgi:hypothetical protein